MTRTMKAYSSRLIAEGEALGKVKGWTKIKETWRQAAAAAEAKLEAAAAKLGEAEARPGKDKAKQNAAEEELRIAAAELEHATEKLEIAEAELKTGELELKRIWSVNYMLNSGTSKTEIIYILDLDDDEAAEWLYGENNVEEWCQELGLV